MLCQTGEEISIEIVCVCVCAWFNSSSSHELPCKLHWQKFKLSFFFCLIAFKLEAHYSIYNGPLQVEIWQCDVIVMALLMDDFVHTNHG